MSLLIYYKIFCHSRNWVSADPVLEAQPGLSSLLVAPLNVGRWALESPVVAINTWVPSIFSCLGHKRFGMCCKSWLWLQGRPHGDGVRDNSRSWQQSVGNQFLQTLVVTPNWSVVISGLREWLLSLHSLSHLLMSCCSSALSFLSIGEENHCVQCQTSAQQTCPSRRGSLLQFPSVWLIHPSAACFGRSEKMSLFFFFS